MNITCPRCDFSREVPADRLPARAVIATCPHCRCRFRFAPGQGVLEVLPETVDHEHVAAAGDADPRMGSQPGFQAASGAIRPYAPDEEDDPLPPGAIVPGRDLPQSRNIGSHGPDVVQAAQGSKDPADAGDVPQGAKGADAAPASGGEEEDIRVAASKAYAREAARPDLDTALDAARQAPEEGWEEVQRRFGGNPWEAAPEPDGWLSAFYQTSIRVMFAAPRFFAALRPVAPQLRVLCFFLVISVVQVVVERAWAGMLLTLMAPSAATDPELEKLLTMLAPQLSLPMTLLLKTGFSVLQLYLFSGLVYLTYRFMVPARADFSLVFQIMAYSAAPALLCVIPLLGSLAGFVWGFGCMLVGCRTAFNLTWPQTLLGFAPVFLLLGPLLLQIILAVQS